jgi:hypothetical protein
MFHRAMRLVYRPKALAACGTVLAGLLALSVPAHARVWFGFGFPVPFFAPPPYYYPPPVYYYPPPGYYPPPPAYAYRAPPAPPYASLATPYAPSHQSCVTGGAVCPMEHPVAAGSACYCTTAQGRAWGRAT